MALTRMLVPLAAVTAALMVGLLWVSRAQDHASSEIAVELTTISDLRRDVGHAARLLVTFERSGDHDVQDRLTEVAGSVEIDMARSAWFDDDEERRLAGAAVDSWSSGMAIADRAFDSGDTSEISSAVQMFDHASDRLADLDRSSRTDLQATMRESASQGRAIVLAAAAIAGLVTAYNLLVVRRILSATVGPLRQLTEGVSVFSIDDLEHRVVIEGDAEFRAVGQSFNAMADRLRDTLGSLEHQALHDALTGLPNREGLVRRLAQPGPADRTVLLFDLDGFKALNDGLGHAAGDEALVKIGHRLQRAVQPGDLVARLGGDEFAVVLDDPASVGDPDGLADRLLRRMAEPLEIAGRAIVLHASGGLSSAPGEDPGEAMRRADVALYVAKDAGTGKVRRFHPEMLSEVEERLELGTDLRLAVDRGEIEVHYQPTVCTATHRVNGVEALARWRHPTHGLIPPLSFIPIAEASGQILALGRFVLDAACEQAVTWQTLPGLAELSVAVNVSATQLHDDVVIEDVAGALDRSGLRPSLLTLEVTESVMADPEAVARVHALKALGVRVALDDFGTGYSSLSYLQRLPIDILKIDKSFIDGLGSRADRGVLANAIVRLGQSLGLETIAEGVERDDQVHILAAVGCDSIQGYLFAPPQLPRDLEGRLLELATTTRSSPEPETGTVEVHVGPLDAEAAREWLRHAHWVLDEVEAGRLLAEPVHPGVSAMMRDYLHRWTVVALEGATFTWSSHEDPDALGLVMRKWLPISEALAAIDRRGTFLISDEARRFSEALVDALLLALTAEQPVPPTLDAGALARVWPNRTGPTPAAAQRRPADS